MTAQTPVESYEALYAQLQQVVDRLEAGELPLDETLRLYEQGVRLAAACQRLLDSAELRVRELAAGEPDPDLEA
jgi:exodeoxyribonuclease VII small subunit